MKKIKSIGLVAHDNQKKELLEWIEFNWEKLIEFDLICTGTTGKLVEALLLEKSREAGIKPAKIIRLKSGPLGGDQQMGAMIAEGKIDLLIFLWDPMEQQPHDVDVKALLRITVLYNIPAASNRSSADFIISSQLMKTGYNPVTSDYSSYLERSLKK